MAHRRVGAVSGVAALAILCLAPLSATRGLAAVLSQENCAYMPNRAAIEKAGLNIDLLVPYSIAEIGGLPHKTDGQKVWVDHITVRAE